MTMLSRARCLSSLPDAFAAKECDNLKTIFLKLKYPEKFIESQNQEQIRDVQANAHPFGLFCRLKIKDQLTLYEDSFPILERK